MKRIKRLDIISYIIYFSFLVLFINFFCLQIIKNSHYKKIYNEATLNIIEGKTAPRGRIYDRNHTLIVDNKPVKVIAYKKEKNISQKEEINLAYKLADILDIDYKKINLDIKKTFWIKNNPDLANSKITEEEILNLKYRKITAFDIEKLKRERITEEELSSLNERDLEAAFIYYLMNKGYSYEEKIIKNENVTDLEYAKIASNLDNYKGVFIRLDWDRNYLYGDTFRGILGNISSSEKGLPEEFKDYYLKKGYTLNDRVGISYLEYQYDEFLRGVKDKYKVNKDLSKDLIKEGKRGNDIVLTIDINLQKDIEEILEDELLKAKEEANTEFYNRSFVIITNPKTGEILAMAGKQIVKDYDGYKIYDFTPGIFTFPVVVGSIVKGASQIVGYNQNVLEIGEKRYDNCVKLKGVKEKCSWKYLGLIDDVKALKLSSNTYQFYTALKVAGANYYYDMPFKLENNAFDIYRNTFKEFGLGVKTHIDLPNEFEGLKGKTESIGLLLDFSIGQYDNYTPLQLAQYMNTIANNGSRMKLFLLKEVYDSKDELKNKIYETKIEQLNKVDTKIEYIERVKEGFKAVLDYGGTGSGYIDKKFKPAGKTGTSQSFVDSNNDGKVDTETVSNTFAGYAPYDDPKVTFTVVSPDTYNYATLYQSSVNKRISKRVSDKYFEYYPN